MFFITFLSLGGLLLSIKITGEFAGFGETFWYWPHYDLGRTLIGVSWIGFIWPVYKTISRR